MIVQRERRCFSGGMTSRRAKRQMAMTPIMMLQIMLRICTIATDSMADVFHAAKLRKNLIRWPGAVFLQKKVAAAGRHFGEANR